jgi:hypothetical protein
MWNVLKGMFWFWWHEGCGNDEQSQAAVLLIIHLAEFMNIPDTKEIGQYLTEHAALRLRATNPTPTESE